MILPRPQIALEHDVRAGGLGELGTRRVRGRVTYLDPHSGLVFIPGQMAPPDQIAAEITVFIHELCRIKPADLQKQLRRIQKPFPNPAIL